MTLTRQEWLKRAHLLLLANILTMPLKETHVHNICICWIIKSAPRGTHTSGRCCHFPRTQSPFPIPNEFQCNTGRDTMIWNFQVKKVQFFKMAKFPSPGSTSRDILDACGALPSVWGSYYIVSIDIMLFGPWSQGR